MINPECLDICKLPSLPLEEKYKLPDIAGIYLCINEAEEIYYIGQSKNINRRWLQHHRNYQLEDIGNIRIAWIAISETSLLNDIETALIEYFNPSLNNSLVSVPQNYKGRMSLYLTPSLKKELETLAKARSRTMSNMVEVLIMEAVEKAKANKEI